MTELVTIAHLNTNITDRIRPFSKNGAIAAAIFILPMALFGIFANVVTIIVIVRSNKLSKSVFNFMIVSLCVSDLFSAIISPLSLHRRTLGYDDWMMPEFFCKVFWSFDNWTSIVTSFHILLFSGVRMFSISAPTYYQRMTLYHVKIMVCITWFIAFGSGFIPYWLWFGLKDEDRSEGIGSNWPDCTLKYQWLQSFKLYTKVAYGIFFYMPMIVVSIISPIIAKLILKKRKERIQRKNNEVSAATGQNTLSDFERKHQRRENSAILQLFVIVGSFMLGYVPSSVGLICAFICSIFFVLSGCASDHISGRNYSLELWNDILHSSPSVGMCQPNILQYCIKQNAERNNTILQKCTAKVLSVPVLRNHRE
ncbi:D(1A) dopamine receptor-like isoform X2 [Styela clava]